MSGTPTEAELQTQWKNVVDVLETFRAHVDAMTNTRTSGQVACCNGQ